MGESREQVNTSRVAEYSVHALGKQKAKGVQSHRGFHHRSSLQGLQQGSLHGLQQGIVMSVAAKSSVACGRLDVDTMLVVSR